MLLRLLAAIGLILPALSAASTCPTTNLVSEPPVFEWTYDSANDYYSGTLEMGEVTLDLDGGTLTTRAYRQEGGSFSIPGPTLVLVPGNTYVLKFKNTLPYEPLSPDHNVFKDPNVTNLHTHGLHISGETPSDDVTRWFEGGYGGDYVYQIPADHMGGSYWYHAHHHGSTFLQVASGAFGMIVIDDSNDGIPPNVAAMEEKLLQIVYLDPSVAGTGGDTLISGTLGAAWTINGQTSGNLCLPPDTWQHWRILVADADARTKTLEIGDGCEVALMARDGVWRTQVPKAIPSNTLNLSGASRADIAIRCSADSSVTIENQQVASIFVDGTSDSGPHPYAEGGKVSETLWDSFRPQYLRDLRSESVSNFETVNMGARTINGSKFDVEVPTFTTIADGVQEWQLKGATNHPFHLHVYHFQPQENCGDYEAGEYYDTIASSCTVRFDLNPATSTVFEGITIFHCHILDHEDQGAMGWMDVIGGEPAPVYPVAGLFSEYYSLGGTPPATPPAAPSGLAALAVSSSQIDLSWTDNAEDEDSYEVEQSIDGTNFSLIAVLGADAASHSATGLNPNTNYFYRVSASNSAGSSGYSNVDSATTLSDGGSGTSVEVGSIVVSTANAGGGFKIGVADITVVDDLGNPVADATVGGYFTGDINETIAASPPTDAAGLTTVNSTQSVKGKVTLSFCVTAISHPDLENFSGSVCGSL